MPYDVAPNERFLVQAKRIGREGHPVLVVDDFLRDPQSMVRYAIDEAKFGPASASYPGIRAATPLPYQDALAFGLGRLVCDFFHVRMESAIVHDSFFAIVTTPPEQLRLEQRLPHIDDVCPGMIAFLHYLCEGYQGGTAFYRHRATGYESLDEEKAKHMGALIEQDLARSGPLAGQYINSDNPIFEQTASFEARFNRLLVFRSRTFHSGQIGPDTKLDADPRIGRLTTNTFVRFT